MPFHLTATDRTARLVAAERTMSSKPRILVPLAAALVAAAASCRTAATPPATREATAPSSVETAAAATTAHVAPCLERPELLVGTANVEVALMLQPSGSPGSWAKGVVDAARGWLVNPRPVSCAQYDVQFFRGPSARVRIPAPPTSCAGITTDSIDAKVTFKPPLSAGGKKELDVAVLAEGCTAEVEMSEDVDLPDASVPDPVAEALAARAGTARDGGAPAPSSDRVGALRLRVKSEKGTRGCDAPSRIDVEVWTKKPGVGGGPTIGDVSLQFDGCSDAERVRSWVRQLREKFASSPRPTGFSSKRDWAERRP